MHLKQSHAKVGVSGFRWAGESELGHGDAQRLRDQADCFRKRNVLDFLDEGEDISRLTATEAVEKLACRVN